MKKPALGGLCGEVLEFTDYLLWKLVIMAALAFIYGLIFG